MKVFPFEREDGDFFFFKNIPKTVIKKSYRIISINLMNIQLKLRSLNLICY